MDGVVFFQLIISETLCIGHLNCPAQQFVSFAFVQDTILGNCGNASRSNSRQVYLMRPLYMSCYNKQNTKGALCGALYLSRTTNMYEICGYTLAHVDQHVASHGSTSPNMDSCEPTWLFLWIHWSTLGNMWLHQATWTYGDPRWYGLPHMVCHGSMLGYVVLRWMPPTQGRVATRVVAPRPLCHKKHTSHTILTRSRYGTVDVEMNHTQRPSDEVRPTNLLRSIGNSIVTLPSSSTYFSATQFCRIASSFTASSGQKQQPSPCATHSPAMPARCPGVRRTPRTVPSDPC